MRCKYNSMADNQKSTFVISSWTYFQMYSGKMLFDRNMPHNVHGRQIQPASHDASKTWG